MTRTQIEDFNNLEDPHEDLTIGIHPEAARSLKKSKYGLTYAGTRALFAELGLPYDGTWNFDGKSDNRIATWIGSAREMLRRKNRFQRILHRLTEPGRRLYLGLSDGPTDWTRNKETPEPKRQKLTAGELAAIKALEGKRGGVMCRGCHRHMVLDSVDGGYDWRCERCGITWCVRFNGNGASDGNNNLTA